jgi:hypothetical protein
MKTKLNLFKQNITTIKYILIVFALIGAYSNIFAKQNADSILFSTYTGKVIDKETNKPVMYASIHLQGSNLGINTNLEGEFILKVPKDKNNNSIVVNHIGYKISVLTCLI